MKPTNLFALSLCLWAMTSCSGGSGGSGSSLELKYLPFIDNEGETVYVEISTGETKGTGYSAGSAFTDGMALVKIGADEYNYINEKFEMVLDSNVVSATIFGDGLAWTAAQGAPLKVIDKKGKVKFTSKDVVTKANYDGSIEFAMPFTNGYSLVLTSDIKIGVVDTKGNLVIKPEYTKCTAPYVVNNYFICAKDVDGAIRYGVMNTKDQTVINFGNEAICSDYNLGVKCTFELCNQAMEKGLFPIKSDGKWGIMNTKGEMIINTQYNGVWVDGDMFIIKQKDFYGWCDKSGKIVILPVYRVAYPFGNSEYTGVRSEAGFWTFIDREGHPIPEARFYETKQFVGNKFGIACDNETHRWGLVDKTGKWIVEPNFEDIIYFGSDSYLVAEVNRGSCGIIDIRGKIIANPNYESLSDYITVCEGIQNGAVNQYVDPEPAIKEIMSQLKKLKGINSIGTLMEALNKDESNISRTGLCSILIPIHKNMVSIENLSFEVPQGAWSKVSDGWYGYNYVLNRQAPINSFNVTFKFDYDNRIVNALPEIKNYITDHEAELGFKAMRVMYFEDKTLKVEITN